MAKMTHFGADGGGRMVDVGTKPVTERYARASAVLIMKPDTLLAVRQATTAKGDVLGMARMAGIMAAKKTSEWIPLCHPIVLDGVEFTFEYPDKVRLQVLCEARATAKTGVEMEALTGVTAAALAVYDMCKAIDRGMQIERVQLEEKSGGQSGHFKRD